MSYCTESRRRNHCVAIARTRIGAASWSRSGFPVESQTNVFSLTLSVDPIQRSMSPIIPFILWMYLFIVICNIYYNKCHHMQQTELNLLRVIQWRRSSFHLLCRNLSFLSNFLSIIRIIWYIIINYWNF